MRLSEAESATVLPFVAGSGSRPADAAPSTATVPARSGPSRDVFDALADAYRREILGMLCAGGACVNELAARLPISRPAVSRHLKLLAAAGLIVETRVGTKHVFSLRPEGARAVLDYLERVWGRGTWQPVPVAPPADDPTTEEPSPDRAEHPMAASLSEA
jgi:DNA-binding transcriptional ArsR family regulator